jgi:hypothetical protein
VDFTEGTISYVTSNNVYVRFSDTEHLSNGDTLLILQNDDLIPALIVTNKSSISAVCTPLPGFSFQENDKVLSRNAPSVEMIETIPEDVDTVSKTHFVAVPQTVKTEEDKSKRQQQIGGRLSISSYTNWSNAVDDVGQRMRYTFSFSGQYLGGSKLSMEMYVSFVHHADRWQEIKDDIFNGLKIYNFSLRYDISQKTKIWFGRKINYKLTSLGAIDGLQFEHHFGSLSLGLVAGSRPDYKNYSINPGLFQYGVYLSHELYNGTGRMENTIAFMNQTNEWKTDRRFLYFQHTNTLIKKLFFMGTVEFDLFSMENGNPKNTFNLSNLYLLLRFKVFKNFSISGSYTARQNIIYYETYKDFLERLLESPTLQGFRLMLNYRPVKYLSVGLKGGYRFRPDDPKPTNNIYGYVTYSMIPGIKASATGSVTWLETSYLKGLIYSFGLSRDFAKGKIFTGINYRYVSYDFTTSDLPLLQHIAEVNINWRIYRKLTMGIYYEGAFESINTFNRVYLNLTQRF